MRSSPDLRRIAAATFEESSAHHSSKSKQLRLRPLYNSGLCLADFALSVQRRTLFHLETNRVHGTSNDRSGSQATGFEEAISDDLTFDHSLLCFQIPLYAGILSDGQTALRGNIATDRTIKDEIARTIQITFDLNITGKMAAHEIKRLEVYAVETH